MPEPFTIQKIDEHQRLVFGYANVSVAKGDHLITDLQGDRIAPEELEKGAYDFVLFAREADEMHEGGAIGHLVESMVFVPDKLQALATDPATGKLDEEGLAVLKRLFPPRWWVGFKVEPSAFSKVLSGEYTMFSIAGTADAVNEHAA